MMQLTFCKADGIGFEVHMISDENHIVKTFDTDIQAKEYFIEMAKDLVA